MPETATLPELISQAQTTEEQFLRHIAEITMFAIGFAEVFSFSAYRLRHGAHQAHSTHAGHALFVLWERAAGQILRSQGSVGELK